MQDSNPSTVLIADADAASRAALRDILSPRHRLLEAASGAEALRLAAAPPRPDLIVLDAGLADPDSREVYEGLRAGYATQGIPVVFLIPMDEALADTQGPPSGAVDYVTKPVVPLVLLARVRAQLELKQIRDRLADQNAWLEAEIIQRMAENEITQEVSIRALASLAEARDTETGNHILRTQAYVYQLALHLRPRPRFAAVLGDRYIQLLARSAPLHDLGKVGIPDCILRKPGKLTAEEWEVMKTHAKLGSDAIERAEREAMEETDAAQPAEFLALAKEIAHWHHEKWDGSGYPDGLAGDAIPVSARIMALADVFDALISRRVYKDAMPLDEVRKIIAEGRGRHFDPDMADTFLEHFEIFRGIAERHRDPD